MTCSLVKNDDTDIVVKHTNGKPALSGSLTSSLHRLKDTHNIDGAYFVFGDVSCKEAGSHRLKFCLFDLHKYVDCTSLVELTHSNHVQGDKGRPFPGINLFRLF